MSAMNYKALMSNEQERPSPDKLLEAIQQEESLRGKGRLKIFLGMAAGVGKTYSMLEEAQILHRDGVDVVVGLVDTHGREETAQLLRDLQVIPRKIVEYRGKNFEELDLDAIIALHPTLVLVDELAHTNVPGLRHAKRWQDVLEILDSGIDVHTTLNIQHIESLNDVVKGISGVSVHETVPDLIVEKAAFIQIVDLTPEELLQRLKEGKIYLGDQSQIAAKNFFQKDKLTALREIVLRYGAEKVDRDLLGMSAVRTGAIEWKPREKFLVAVSHSPTSQRLIRTTRRLASNAKAPWVALYVNCGVDLNEQENNQLAKNLLLARDLGAEVITINDPSISQGIQKMARQKGVTQIIVGRHVGTSGWGFFNRFRLFDNLIDECKDIDIHIIKQERYNVSYHRRWLSWFFPRRALQYLWMLFYLAFVTLINHSFSEFVSYKITGVILLLSIIISSLFFGVGPVIMAALSYPLIMDFFFIKPYSFGELNIEDRVVMFIYVLIAISIGILINRERRYQKILLAREKTTDALFEIVQHIGELTSIEETCKTIKVSLEKLVNGVVEFMIKEIDNGLVFKNKTTLIDDQMENNTALWVFDHQKEAGWSTDTLPASQNLYIPLKGSYEAVGLLVYRPKTGRLLTAEEKNVLYTVGQQLGGYIERIFADIREQEHEQLKRIERIHKTILDRLSKEFEKPISNLSESIDRLKVKGEELPKNGLKAAIEDIDAAFRGIVKILLSIATMSQLSEGMIPLKKSKHNIEEFLKESCEDSAKYKKGYHFVVKVEEGLPEVAFDDYLIRILIYNLLNNALENSPEGSTIIVEGKRAKGYLIITISDEGQGIPEDQLETVFEKFYRLPESKGPGAGLGLAIAKTIAEVHQGYLKAENLPVKGTRFSLYLPLE